MRVLLSDGSGLTARQCATLLAPAGHKVGVLAPAGLSLTAMTGAVRHRPPVPVFGPDPLGWAQAMLAVLDTGRYDVLLPTQEQVAVIARSPTRSAHAACARRCRRSRHCAGCSTSSPPRSCSPSWACRGR